MNKENLVVVYTHTHTHTHTYTLEFYSVIKTKEILPFSGKWMEPEIIILSVRKISITFSLTCGI
jgi:hypothetical protein